MKKHRFGKSIICIWMLILNGCTALQPNQETADLLDAEITEAIEQRIQDEQSPLITHSLFPPLRIEMPFAAESTVEKRFDLAVNNAPAREIFMVLVSDTPYSMLVHPEVTGVLSLDLKDVTVFEALDAIYELYGYDYKVKGKRISVLPLTIQSRIFQVNYLTGQREGKSEIRINTSGGPVFGGNRGLGGGFGFGGGLGMMGAGGMQGIPGNLNSTKVTTKSTTDFWETMIDSLTAIVGTGDGRSVIVNPETGVLVVTAFPKELRTVETYLRASQLAAERQVILEAKIIEVQLNAGAQQGVNWAAFGNSKNSNFSVGQMTPGAQLSPDQTLVDQSIESKPGSNLRNLVDGAMQSGAGGIFGLAFQAKNFAAMISFLETQGNVHVLSSPRIATLNNQKAVLKVGQDELFVTNVTGSTQATLNVQGNSPTVTMQSFFSGISLDVTPRIDDQDNIILHVHPIISNVSQENREVETGVSGVFRIPVPRSQIQETDSIVRAKDGQIVAIGGLMSQSQVNNRTSLPGLGDAPGVGVLFRQNNRAMVKRELVILLKPTIVQADGDWSQDIEQSRTRMRNIRY